MNTESQKVNLNKKACTANQIVRILHRKSKRNRMKLNYVILLCLLSATMLTTCKSELRYTASGCVVESAHNYVTIVSGSDTLTYSIANLERDSQDKILYRDSVLITYINDFGFCDATSLIVVGHNLPYINNRSDMLLGTWRNEKQSMELTFNSDNTVDIHAEGEPTREQWIVDGKNVIFGNLVAEKSSQLGLVRVDNSTLTLSDGDQIVYFTKTTD